MTPSVAGLLAFLGAAPAFRIESPSQTPRSILVAWAVCVAGTPGRR